MFELIPGSIIHLHSGFYGSRMISGMTGYYLETDLPFEPTDRNCVCFLVSIRKYEKDNTERYLKYCIVSDGTIRWTDKSDFYFKTECY